MAAACQRDGGGQTAKPCTDYEDLQRYKGLLHEAAGAIGGFCLAQPVEKSDRPRGVREQLRRPAKLATRALLSPLCRIRDDAATGQDNTHRLERRQPIEGWYIHVAHDRMMYWRRGPTENISGLAGGSCV